MEAPEAEWTQLDLLLPTLTLTHRFSSGPSGSGVGCEQWGEGRTRLSSLSIGQRIFSAWWDRQVQAAAWGHSRRTEDPEGEREREVGTEREGGEAILNTGALLALTPVSWGLCC